MSSLLPSEASNLRLGGNLLHPSWFRQLRHLPSLGQRLACGHPQARPVATSSRDCVTISCHEDAQTVLVSALLCFCSRVLSFLGEESFLCLAGQFLPLS